MSDTMLIDTINRYRTSELRASGCHRCLRTRARWLKTEFARQHRTT
jgi:hypothetical protein